VCVCVCALGTTWLYSTVIGCIPLSTDGAYTYLGSARLRICFIDFTATSGGSTFASLLLCAVVGPSLIAVSVCYSQIFIAARVQAQRIYDTELAAVAAGRRVSYLSGFPLFLFFFCIVYVRRTPCYSSDISPSLPVFRLMYSRSPRSSFTNVEHVVGSAIPLLPVECRFPQFWFFFYIVYVPRTPR